MLERGEAVAAYLTYKLALHEDTLVDAVENAEVAEIKRAALGRDHHTPTSSAGDFAM